MPDQNQDHDQEKEPTMTPGRFKSDALQVEASEEEKQRGDVTEVTSLELDRTPED